MTMPWRLRLLPMTLAFLIGACAPTAPTNFYTLSTTVAVSTGEADPTQGPVIGISPIVLPQYLDRPQIVRRGDGNRLILSDFDSWGEPVQGMIERVLVEDIGRLLRTNNVVMLPQRLDIPLDAQIDIEVFRFEAETNGRVVLEARWRVIEPRDERGFERDIFRSQRTSLAEQIASPEDYNAIAGAMSRLLAQLSQEVATAIIGMSKA